MKTFTALLLFAIILGCKIEVDAGSFNLSGSLDPGFTFGTSRSLQQKYEARNNDDNDSDWPQPIHINNFEVPESFNDPITDEAASNDNKAHKHRSHHRAHRH